MKELPKVYFERLLESSPDIVIAVDSNGMVIFYNDGAQRTLGYSAKEMLGAGVDSMYADLDEARRVMTAMRDPDIDGPGEVKNFETAFLSKSGESVPVAISGSIIHDNKGREQGSIGFAKDIGLLRRHEQLVTLGELAVGLAHEINNPLEVLVNQVEMLERYLKQKASHEDYTREHERIDAVKLELRHIQAIVERVGEMAAGGDYSAREYMPGQLMTDLGLDEETDLALCNDHGHTEHHEMNGRTVLVVDDDDEIRASMADILGGEGCRVVTTSSGAEALRYIGQNGVDLVISDVQMPDMDGYELFQRMRGEHAEVPMVLMTAYYYDKDHVIKRSKAKGLSDVIFKKPIDPERLYELVDARIGG